MEETNNYWMLITTRHNNVGVLKLYTSTDLITLIMIVFSSLMMLVVIT